MNRKDELTRLCEGLDSSAKTATAKLINDIIFLETRLEQLRQLPFIEINPDKPTKQRPTVAAKQYKELLQQYNNCIKILLSAIGKSETKEESPLREYLKKMREQ